MSTSKRPSIVFLLLADMVGYFYSAVPAALAWFGAGAFIYILSTNVWLMFLAVIISPLVLSLLFILICFLFQRVLPKMKPGIYRPGVSKGAIVWHLNNSLAQGLEIASLKMLIFSNKTLKWLYFRAMGAKIAFGIFSSTLVTFREYPLITIGEGSSIGAYCHISCHNFQGEKILLAPIVIGKNVFIGMKTLIGPKTTIGDDVSIGGNNNLSFDTVAPNTIIKNFEYEYGKNRKYLVADSSEKEV